MAEIHPHPTAPSTEEKASARSIELRSESVQEVMGRIPPWTIRYGITVLFGLVVLLLCLAWLIRYPDVINASGTLTSSDPPRDILARTNGRLVRLIATDGALVQKGSALAVIESAASPMALDSLRWFIPELQAFADGHRDSLPELDPLQLGEVQRAWAEARNLSSELLRWRTDPYREQRNAAMRQKIGLYKKLIRTTEEQLAWARRKQKNTLAEAVVDSVLLGKAVMANSEFRTRQNVFIDQQMSLGGLENTLHQNRITLVELEAQLNDQLFTDGTKQRELEQRLRAELSSLQAFVDSWQLNNELSAPIKGRVHFASRLNKDQPIKEGDVIFRVETENENYVVEAVLPSSGSAKVAVGQAAFIRLDGFPSDEFGRLVGTVRAVSHLSSEAGYRVQIDLPQGLTTSFQRTLEFMPEMKGQVEVVTKDRSILGRVLDTLRSGLDR